MINGWKQILSDMAGRARFPFSPSPPTLKGALPLHMQ